MLETKVQEPAPGIIVVKFSGRLTAGPESAGIEVLVRKLLGENRKKLVFDLSGVNYIDSTGGRGRVRPLFSLDASAGVVLRQKEKQSVRVQADAQNLTNRLNVLDFAGLFSGTALGTPRSAGLRLQAEF